MSGKDTEQVNLENDGPAVAGTRGGTPLLFLGIAIIVLALALGFGVLLPRLRAEPLPSEPRPAAADVRGETLADRMATSGAMTSPPPAGLQVIQSLSEVPKGPIERLELVYFHRTHRCSGCLKAEERVRKTLDTYHSDKLQSGEIVLFVEDVEQPVDPALVRKYGAFGPSLFFGVDKGGISYTYADNDIWFSANDDAKFMESLRSQIDSVLEGQ